MKRVFLLAGGPSSYAISVTLFLVVSLILVHGCTAESSHQRKAEDKSLYDDSKGVRKSNKNLQPSQTGKLECADDDKECEKDRLGLEAIGKLHLLIDDDHNGNVDQSESDEFLRDELEYTDGFERQALFHNNDKLISVDDLWRAWKYSVVYNWTVDDVIEWLVQDVDLPQYSNSFHTHAIDGSYLPRLVNSTLLGMLGIRFPAHKHKLSLKAMDAVLFGGPKRIHSYVKDVLLVSSLIITFGGAWFTYLQHRYSKTQYKKMLNDLESLQKAEEALKKLSKELSEAEKNQKSIPPEKQEELMLLRKGSLHLKLPNVKRVNGDTSPSSLSREGSLVRRRREGETERRLRQTEEEVVNLREALYEAENKLEVQQQLESQWSVPTELQAWLQFTHELEVQQYNAKHQAAERQLCAARDGCDKIKKRNRAFFGSLRMAHSNSMDDIDQSLLDARAALEEVKQDLQERLNRWHNMELLCGFPIITNPGLSNLRQMLGRESLNGNVGRNIPGSILAPASIEEADEDLSPVAFVNSVQNEAIGSNNRPRVFSAGFPTLATGASKTYLKQNLAGSTGSLSHTGKAPSPGQTALARRESHENMLHSSAHAVPTSSVSFHLGDGSNAHHERSHSNVSSAHTSSVTNGHPAHHPYPHQGHKPTLGAYPQSYSYPPMKQSSMATLQAPGSHMSVASSAGILSKAASSHSGSYVNLRHGLSTSNSNLANSGQRVYHNHEDHQYDGYGSSGHNSTPRHSQSQNSPPVNLAPPQSGWAGANDSWEDESTDSLQHQTSLSLDRPQLLRSPEVDESLSADTESLQSASALANTKREKKLSIKMKLVPKFLRKNSTKQKTS